MELVARWTDEKSEGKNFTQGKTFQHAFASKEMCQHQRPYGLNPSALPCRAVINAKSHRRPSVHLAKGL